MERNRRRHLTGFGYIGFGNNQTVFNQNSKKAFSELKHSLNQTSHKHYQCHFSHQALSKEAKDHIKNTIRKEERIRNRKIYFVFFLSVVVVGMLIYHLIAMFADALK
ncbi:hypothetical protein V8G61_07965 [Gaetbulibacter sp. M240]|uniref:hypothetical protein n=1 Tax=Gaetbulibacter sp. M240 TaxID=3126511 RepID=UPI00374F8BF9